MRCQYFYGNFAFRQRYKKIRNISNVIFDGRPLSVPWDLGMGSKVQNSTFSEHGHVAYQIKENHECSNVVANILLADTLTPRMGQIGQNLPFSEHGHIEYQFKGNQKMQQQGSKYLPGDAYPLAPTLGMGSEGQNSIFFQNMVMLHIKIKENHECSNVVANILPADPPPTYTPTLWMGSVGKNQFFFSTWSH